ncbi:MAG: hypothetical protein QM500_04475 [Methylococcales bacterium]
MSKIIQFPKRPDPGWENIENKIENELINVIPEVREKIKNEIISLLKHYSTYDKQISLSFPDSTTDKQINAMTEAFDNRNNMIKEMLSDLVKTKTELCIEKYTKS